MPQRGRTKAGSIEEEVLQFADVWMLETLENADLFRDGFDLDGPRHGVIVFFAEPLEVDDLERVPLPIVPPKGLDHRGEGALAELIM